MPPFADADDAYDAQPVLLLSDLVRELSRSFQAQARAEGFPDLTFDCEAEGMLGTGLRAWETSDVDVFLTVRGPTERRDAAERLLRTLVAFLPAGVRLHRRFEAEGAPRPTSH